MKKLIIKKKKKKFNYTMKPPIFIIYKVQSHVKTTFKTKKLLKTLNLLNKNTFRLTNNLKVVKKIEHLINIKKVSHY